MRTIDSIEEERSKLYNAYYRYTCEHCGRDMVFSMEDGCVTKVLFEPKEIEVQYEECKYETDENGKLGKLISTEKKTKKELKSSDYLKDIVEFRCPYCGHQHSVEWVNIHDKLCNYWGNNNINFEFTEKESEKVDEFYKKHSSCCREKLGRPFFSSTGGQYSYHIRPTGLGSIITLECHACGEKENITNNDDW